MRDRFSTAKINGAQETNMPTLKMDLNAGKSAVVFSITGGEHVTFTHKVVTEMIAKLVDMRAAMDPPAMTGSPTQGDPVFDHAKNQWSIRPRPKPARGIELLAGHPGLGWMRVNLEPHDAEKLSRAIPLLLLDETATCQ
jgi:hypothetical protein